MKPTCLDCNAEMWEDKEGKWHCPNDINDVDMPLSRRKEIVNAQKQARYIKKQK